MKIKCPYCGFTNDTELTAHDPNLDKCLTSAYMSEKDCAKKRTTDLAECFSCDKTFYVVYDFVETINNETVVIGMRMPAKRMWIILRSSTKWLVVFMALVFIFMPQIRGFYYSTSSLYFYTFLILLLNMMRDTALLNLKPWNAPVRSTVNVIKITCVLCLTSFFAFFIFYGIKMSWLAAVVLFVFTILARRPVYYIIMHAFSRSLIRTLSLIGVLVMPILLFVMYRLVALSRF